MSTLHAAVTLAWIVLVLLTLGYAAVLREVRELRAGLASGDLGPGARRITARSLATDNRHGTLALAVEPGCGSCQVATDALARHLPDWDGPDLRLVSADEAVHDWPSSAALRPLVNAELWDRLAVQSTPMLLRVTPDGTVTERRLVGSPEHLAEIVTGVRAGGVPAGSGKEGTS